MRRLLFAALFLLLCACGQAPDEPPRQSASPAVPLFAEITDDAGLGTGVEPWPDGTYFLPEIMGGGIALFDADGDADLDLLQVRFPPPGQRDAPAPNRLFRQGDDGRFRASDGDGPEDPGYGQGVAVGDADNDGYPDVYYTNYGVDGFYRNRGDGTFARATAEAGFTDTSWSTSAAFFDYDRDGDLDLFVIHYVDYYSGVTCRSPHGIDYCPPKKFDGVRDILYRNRGDGTFEDVGIDAGIATATRGLGVGCADLTRDGWMDIYVANDGEVNQLWVNQGDGTFVDEAVMRGVGFNGSGMPEGSMGVSIAYVDEDGLPDLIMTNLWNQSNTLYLATDEGVFTDESGRFGMAAHDLPYTGFGCGLFDYDHDGDLDFAVVNGRVQEWPPQTSADPDRFWSYYAEPNMLFEHGADGRFTLVEGRGGTFASLLEVDRGLAFGDLDHDGDLDLATNGLDKVRLYRNDAPPPEHRWLAVRALTGRRDAIGAEVTVHGAARSYHCMVGSWYSYGSSSPPRAHFGLGSDLADTVEVLWPDGQRERFALEGLDREVVVRQGDGELARVIAARTASDARRQPQSQSLRPGRQLLAEAALGSVPRPDLTNVHETRLRQALSAAQDAVVETPTAATWGHLGHLYFLHGWPSEAAVCYRNAVELEPDDFGWRYFLGRAYGQSDAARAIDAYGEAIELDPGYVAAYAYCARALRDFGRVEEAKEFLERGRQADPDNPTVELGLGQLHLRARRYDEARRHLERALDLDPERGETHTALSQVHMAQGNRETARHHAELGRRYFGRGGMSDPLFAAVTRFGVSKYWFRHRGQRRLQAGDYARAVHEYARATEEGEDDPVIWSGYGAALLGLGRQAEAVRALERALECAHSGPYAGNVLPEDARLIHTNIGHAYAVTGEPDKAEHHLREALRLDPSSVSAAFNLALVYYRGGRAALALDALSSVPELEDHPRALKLRRALMAASASQDAAPAAH